MYEICQYLVSAGGSFAMTQQGENMTKITCDVCNRQVSTPIKVEFRDGEHPHNGSTMRTRIDLCEVCTKKIPDLRSEFELDDIRARINGGKP